MDDGRIGVWLIGAKGGVAASAMLGLAALQRGLCDNIGLVSELPQFGQLGLIGWNRLVVGGHDIRSVRLFDEVLRMARESRQPGLFEIAEKCREDIEAIDRRIRPGTILGVGKSIESLADADVSRAETPRQAIARLRGDIRSFATAEGLDHVVVVNLASTEPPSDATKLPERWADLDILLDNVPGVLPASSLYAIAALEEGFSFINFTPSLGSEPAAIGELAQLRGTRHYGRDGKTGETLLKSVLAPMFARRNLRVLSWVGHNILGNMDGRMLDDPANKQTKVASKDGLLGEILGYKPNSHVSIEYMPDLGDWKTAWDHIHFAGFLGVPMTLQFTWQGCDSMLAAPLVLDLIRFTDLAHRRGHVGPMPFLASFFKSPHRVAEYGFDRQFEMLEHWAMKH